MIAFYWRQLERWKSMAACRKGCRFLRGTAAIMVDAHNVARARTYAVDADYAGAQS
jgi:hypothetical protein